MQLTRLFLGCEGIKTLLKTCFFIYQQNASSRRLLHMVNSEDKSCRSTRWFVSHSTANLTTEDEHFSSVVEFKMTLIGSELFNFQYYLPNGSAT